MDWTWQFAIQLISALAVGLITARFRLWKRTEEAARQLRSEKARVGLRTVLYAVAATVSLLIFGLAPIVESDTRGSSALVALTLILLGSFVAAALKTSGEDPSGVDGPTTEAKAPS
jgi:hypothetical protein